MDDFVRNKLTEWGFSDWIEKFRDEGIDTECLECLCNEDIADLIPKLGPRAKFKKKLKLFQEEQKTTNPETVDSPAQGNLDNQLQVRPSTSASIEEGMRKLNLQGESSNRQSPRQRCGPVSHSDKTILSKVKKIMGNVQKKLPDQGNKLDQFLKKKIKDLEIDKRELVGVFGKTGAGKSSLINAVIGEKNLLPVGSVKACTTVMIKVEANMRNQKHEAEIEFITKEEWKDELWSLLNFLGDDADQEDDEEDDQEDDEDQDTVDKLSALYGEEWKDKTPENLMEDKYFKEVPEFLQSQRKLLTAESAKELSPQLVKYTSSESNDGERKEVRRWYWPLVKCVTVRVPNNDLLQHVTLVDLPGNGDRNKSRDNMWKGVVGSCSTVWIVSEIKRAAAEREAWDILKSACSFIGNGGECQRIHFICTKSDFTGVCDDDSAGAVRARILQDNKKAKDTVNKEFRKLKEVKKHFSDESFKIFTVSSKEFLKRQHLTPEETEIPRLQKFLQDLNDCHSETLNYVSGAHGILSLIQGARSRAGADRNTDVCRELKEKMKQELEKVRQPMEKTNETFEKCLTEGVEKSKRSWERLLKPVLKPGGAFHKTLKCVVQNGGIHKPKKGKLINLNMMLTSCLTDSIDEEFKKTFPNEAKSGPFNGLINSFSLGTERLMRERQEYKDVQLQLIFLLTEEEKMKTKLNKIIREQKKMIYNSLMETMEDNMLGCYREAAEIKGGGSLKNMKSTIEKHVRDSKDVMFQRAKNVMLEHLENLMVLILGKLENTMKESIELSLNADDDSIPDVSDELQMVKKYRDELMKRSIEAPPYMG